MPTSPRKMAANRTNAARSTGPRTAEGKSRSSRNAVRHGFAASTYALARFEDPEEIARLKADLVAVYQPANSQELFALERAALAQQSILRAARLEVGIVTSCLNETIDDEGYAVYSLNKVLHGTLPQNSNYAFGEGYRRMTANGHGALSWSLFLRYQAQAERHYRRAIEEFERLKKLRGQLPSQEIPAEIPPAALSNEPISELQPQPQPQPAEPLPVPPAASQTNPIRPASPAGPAENLSPPMPGPTGHSGTSRAPIPPRPRR